MFIVARDSSVCSLASYSSLLALRKVSCDEAKGGLGKDASNTNAEIPVMPCTSVYLHRTLGHLRNFRIHLRNHRRVCSLLYAPIRRPTGIPTWRGYGFVFPCAVPNAVLLYILYLKLHIPAQISNRGK